jgi:general secretion pathway protein A
MVQTTTKYRLTSLELGKLSLNEHPFRLSADPRFLYLTEQHKAALGRLEDLVTWREGLSVVEGPVGTGKTTLARRLYELCLPGEGRDLETIYVHTAAYHTALGALRDIGKHFGLESRRSYTDQLRDFERHLLDLRKKDFNAVLIIDDAQFMRGDSLHPIQDMLNFDQSSKLIQIVLFGQQEIHRTLANDEALLDRVVYWYKVGPLTYTEMVLMLQFRLSVAMRSEPFFTDRAYEVLYDFSRGVPRKLIIVCNETLRLLVERNRSIADEHDVLQAIDIYNQRPVRSENNAIQD